MRRAQLLIFLAAWLSAFAVVLALYLVFGRSLQSMGLLPRALLISGVLVAVMTRLVMPRLVPRVMRWAADREPSLR